MGRSFDEDPLTLAMMPPPDETYEQRLIREAAEAEAKRISDEIDEQIRKEREAERRKKKPVKLLLLGQSESGKTATLKNFQLTYARREWSEEKAAWRAVIFLNLVRNVNEILAHLYSEMNDLPYNPDDSQDDLLIRPPRALPRLKFTDTHRVLRMKLAPLTNVQHTLEQRLGTASIEQHTTSVNTAAPFDQPVSSSRRGHQEFSINSSNGWKSALEKFRTFRNGAPASPTSKQENGSLNSGASIMRTKDTEEDIAEVIASCREDIKALWDDDIVRETLNRRKVRLEDAPGFFINDTDRIANRDYQPTDDDVIRARLRTLGVQEYRFIFDHGRTMGQEWRIYDVGGTRSSRGAWYPYFDDVLNKCDLLQAKLQRGIRIRDSVPSFGDRKNDLTTATRYFQQHFKEISRTNSPIQRPFYVHLTSIIDTRSTAVTLGAVEESILREHLRRADLM
ncbi:hypothetical protein CVT24_003835 [Panaeolus cyanescens]|uniref:Uncharacterized protein n=1 Tax=Panaeolus cyanescens TaxID=181874 RepID=A0A409W7Y2_9AGAR|nr:hypothetical protein CVT24_003835 [Panaeolus cyanescens]